MAEFAAARRPVMADEQPLAIRLAALAEMTEEKFRARDRAVLVALGAMDTRLNAMDGLRETLRDQATRFLTREEFSAAHGVVELALSSARLELSKWSERSENAQRHSAVERAQMEKRLEAMNEFRGQLKDQAATFVTRTEVDVRVQAVQADVRRIEMIGTSAATQKEVGEAIERNDTRIKTIESKLANWDGRLWAVGVGFTTFNVFVSWLVANVHLTH